MDVALIAAIEILHTKIGTALENIKDTRCRLLKMQYLKNEMSKGNCF